jgi:hypothetical protein
VRSQFVIGSVDLALLTSSRSLLANKRHAGLNAGNSAFAATRGHGRMSNQCPLYPQKRTLELSRVMSALCQKQTFYPLFDMIDGV